MSYPHQRAKGIPRPASSYRGARRNAAFEQVRKDRPAGALRQWWRPWGGIRPTGYVDPSRKPDRIRFVGMPPQQVVYPRTQSRTYPGGFATVGQRREQRERQKASPLTAQKA